MHTNILSSKQQKLLPLVKQFSGDFQGIIHIPDLLTLGAMKVFALGHRAKWKD